MSSLRPRFLSISTSKCLVRLLFAFLALALLSAVAMAQDGQRTRGIYPGASYAVSDIDTINTKNGNLMFSIPIASLPPGRGGLTAGVGLFYDSKIFDTNTYFDQRYPGGPMSTELIPSEDGGWRYGFQYEFQLVNRYDHYHPQGCSQTDPEQVYVWKVRMKFPDGSVHVFRPLNYTDGQADDYFYMRPDGFIHTPCGSDTPLAYGTMTYYSADGTFLRLDVQHDGDSDASNNAWTLYLPDGGRVTGGGGAAERIYDRNNNYIEIQSISYNNHPAKKIVDQMNRYLIIEYGPPGDPSEAARDFVYAWRNDENGQLIQLTWTIKWGYAGGTRYYFINPNDVVIGGAFPAPGMVSVTEIDLPTQSGGLTYKFGYDSNNWGEVTSSTLPSGAKANYQFSWSANTSCYDDAMTSYPSQKSLVYRPEYDLSGGVSNTPCDPQTETCITDTWTYSYSYDQTNASIAVTTGPDGGVNKDYFFGNPPGFPNPPFNPVFKSEHPDGTMTETLWQLNYPYGCNLNRDGVNPYVKTEFVTIKNAADTYTKTKIRDYNYDKNGNVWRVAEYDWVDYVTVPHDYHGRVTGIPGGAQLKRVTTNTYYNSTPDAADYYTDSPNVYHKATSPQFRQATQASEVSANGSNALSRTEYVYDNANTTGNLIQQKSWDSTKGAYSNPLASGNSVSVFTQYNQYGMPTLVTDARGYQTQMTYGAIGSFSDLYPTQIKTAYQTPVQRTENREYDLQMGLVTRVTDADNYVSTATTYDVFGRPRLLKVAEGKPEETRTATEYSDVNRRVIVRFDMNSLGDGKLVSIQHYDQLGRLRLSRQLEDSITQSATDETQGIKVQTRYKYQGLNSYQVTSHPYREAYSWQVTGAMDWTRSKADNGGRLVEEQKFGGASLPAPWGSNSSGAGQVVTTYDANFITVTDQAGKVRRSMTNTLDQLVRVDEPDSNGNLGSNDYPVQPTSYTYDTLGNLITVSQGSQTRSFAYTSLGRLISATNPESGAISYSYDNNGNLTQKTDARGVISTYAYDALNRNASVTYTNDPANTPPVTRTYDGATNGVGRLWKTETNSQASGSLTTIDSYDPLGRPLIQRQQFYRAATQDWSASFGVQRTYDLAGHVLSQTYPSGHSVSYNYDSAGRLADRNGQPAFSGNLGDGETRTYAAISGTSAYDAAGRLQQEQYGTLTPLYHKLHYNVRGQLYDMRLSTQSWQAAELDGDRGAIVNYYSSQNFTPGYTGTDNNGNLRRQETYIPGNDFFRQHYDYDELNRLKYVTEEVNGTGNDTFKQSYLYDRWGNRRIDTANTFGAGINNLGYGVDPANNRLTAPAGYQALQYDAAGNLTQDPTSQNPTATSLYDAENRLARVSFPGSNQPIQYVYDGDGRRVRRISASQYVWQVYGMDGELLAEYYAGQFVGGVEQAVPVTNVLFQKEYGYRSGQLLITASSGDDNRIDRLITNFYFAALGREPSATELSQQHAAFIQAAQQGQPQLLAAAQTLGQQLFDLEHSGSEYNQRNRSDEEFVTDLYFAYLQRPPDEGGLGYWVWALSQGLQRAVVRDAFADSGDAEFAALVSTVYGIDSGDRVGHYLWAMYLGVPGNTGDFGADLDTLQAAAAEGQVQVIQAAQTIGTNLFQAWVEDEHSVSDEQFVAGLFHAFLQREPSPSDVTYWVAKMQGMGRGWALSTFAELPATQELAGTLYREILWLTPDHLGTPRIISERSGSLAGIKRHDYLPFGEELFAGTGGRTTTQGYTSDNVRQKFTQKERDNETGLDYFGARYYSSTQGRFTSPDEFTGGPDELYYFAEDASANPTFYADLRNPQSLNKYQYGYNNPLRYVDPDGHCPECEVIKVGTTVATVAPVPVPVKVGAAVVVAGAVAYMYRDEIKAGAKAIWEWARTGNTVADASCPACGSSERMGQALMGNQQGRGQGQQQGQGQSNTASPNPNDPDKRPTRSEGPVFKTNAEAAKQAKELGFTKIGERVRGQAVFKNGNIYITRDVTGHSGGAWKAANSVKDLRNKNTRLGTYDKDLNKIAN